MTLPLPSPAFDRAVEVDVVLGGWRIRVRVLEVAPPAASRFEWLSVVDLETGWIAWPSQVRTLQLDGDFRARVHRAAHSIAATGR